ncbi:MAG: UDP-N-acetylglucosamine 2-epimerase [Bacteroidia bacterium]
MNKRKICVVVTARPSYSRVKTALTAINKHTELELQLVVAASALLNRYGSAVDYIEDDGFRIDAKVFNVLEGENLTAAAKTTGLGILELSTVFDNLKPDAVLTVADRYETMATAIAATYMNIPLIHLQGGEVTGNIDEKVRHSITKLADLHLVSTERAKERVIRMGEDPSKVFVTGCPSIDIAEAIMSDSSLNFDPLKKYGGVGGNLNYSKGYIVLMQHPVTTEYELSRKHMEYTLEAVAELDLPTFVFWPNVDTGSDGTSKALRSFRESEDFRVRNFHFFKNMLPSDFLKLLVNSSCLVGNSSVGIRECAYLGVPVVNIGNRQNRRERASNVIDVEHNKIDIKKAIIAQLEHGSYNSDQIYGKGDAGMHIANTIAKFEFNIVKVLTY